MFNLVMVDLLDKSLKQYCVLGHVLSEINSSNIIHSISFEYIAIVWGWKTQNTGDENHLLSIILKHLFMTYFLELNFVTFRSSLCIIFVSCTTHKQY